VCHDRRLVLDQHQAPVPQQRGARIPLEHPQVDVETRIAKALIGQRGRLRLKELFA
jgi:hypothetical protein